MAGYSKNRQANLEIKYLRKVLTEIETPLPQSLSADALIGKLDNVHQEKKVALLFSGGAFKPQKILAYAAAFVLIVVFALSMRGGGNDPSGRILIEQPDGNVASQTTGYNPPDESVAPVDGRSGNDQPPQDNPPANSGGDSGTQPDPGTQPYDPPGGGIGGVLPVQMDALSEYVLFYRSNAGERAAVSPYVLELTDVENDVILSVVELPGITEVRGLYVQADENVVTLVGLGEEGEISLSIDFSDPRNPTVFPGNEQAGYLQESGACLLTEAE